MKPGVLRSQRNQTNLSENQITVHYQEVGEDLVTDLQEEVLVEEDEVKFPHSH